MIVRASLGGGATPSWRKSFTPFQGLGLWLAVMTTPPSAPRWSAMIATPGVERMPTRITRHPTEVSPAATAFSYIAPDGRESRPSTTVGAPVLRAVFSQCPKAAA